MTTTADKIIKLMDDMKTLRNRVDGELDQLEARLQEIAFNAESESPDPEPLKCWLAKYPHSGVQDTAFFNKTEAEDSFAVDCGGRLVYMREVTPRDEQDRLDAERYRKAKRLPTAIVESLARSASDDWDNIVDKC